jgi:hypothetical protein
MNFLKDSPGADRIGKQVIWLARIGIGRRSMADENKCCIGSAFHEFDYSGEN